MSGSNSRHDIFASGSRLFRGRGQVRLNNIVITICHASFLVAKVMCGKMAPHRRIRCHWFCRAAGWADATTCWDVVMLIHRFNGNNEIGTICHHHVGHLIHKQTSSSFRALNQKTVLDKGRRQTDRVRLGFDFWFRVGLTLTFNPRRAMVMNQTRAKGQRLRLVSSKYRVEAGG